MCTMAIIIVMILVILIARSSKLCIINIRSPLKGASYFCGGSSDLATDLQAASWGGPVGSRLRSQQRQDAVDRDPA